MKKTRHLLFVLLLSLTLTACGKPTPPPEPTPPEPTPQPFRLERLTVELPQGFGAPDELLAAAEGLAGRLQGALRSAGVAAEEVSVTVGTSYGATGEALAAGSVQLAFLPAEAFCRYGAGASLLCGGYDPEKTAGGAAIAGERSEILATDSDYGEALYEQLQEGKPLAFSALKGARWGVLAEGNDAGNRYPALYLADHYAGNTLADLDFVTTYASYEELLRAAAEEEVDIVPLPASVLQDFAALWQLDRTHSDEAGRSGLGQEDGIFSDLHVLGETEPVYPAVAAVSADLPAVLREAIGGALGEISKTAEGQALLAYTGARGYAPAAADALDPMRRILSGEAR